MFLKKLGGELPFVDSMSTVLSIVAMILSVKRYMEQWILWIVVDVVTIIMWAIVFVKSGESTGKSTLTQNLAYVYNTNFVEEVGRDICERAGNEDTMTSEDFMEIMLKHKVKEIEALNFSNKLLFVDTDCLTTKFYSAFLDEEENSVEKNKKLADAIQQFNNFDLVLFLETDIEFVQDGTRNEKIAADRIFYSNEIKELLDKAGVCYHVISGDYEKRFLKAKGYVDGLL